MNTVNPVKLIGEVRSIEFHRNSAVVRLNIDGRTVEAQAFIPVIPYLRNIKVGDRVKIDATLQSNDRRENRFIAPKTIAINHIGLAKENSLPMNSWRLEGRPVYFQSHNGSLSVIIKTEGTKNNFIKVEIPESEVEEFSQLSRNNFILVSGYFDRGRCIARRWRHIRPY